MAKKLEGISTAPWTADRGYNAWKVLCDGGHAILVDDEYGEENEGANLNEAEARLIAAAPDGYEEMYYDCICLNTLVGRIDSGATIHNLREVLSQMSKRMEAVLEKAAGEEFVI